MSLYKREDSQYWWVKITIPGQSSVQKSTGTVDKLKAQEFHDQLASDLWRQSRLGERPTFYWEDAVLRFLDETKHKRDHEGDKARLRWLHPYLEGRALQSIGRELIDRIMLEKRDRAPGTINRYLATLRTIFRKAEREWGWIDKTPVLRMRIEPKKRVRWLTREEAVRLLSELPAHLADAAEFALATGLRQSNVLGLEWSQIDVQRRTAWIYADQAKGKRDVSISLNDAALRALQRCIGNHAKHVFTYRGNPVKGVDNNTWKRACRRAGIEDFRWHDLRHTWASWHVQAGTSLQILMELGGWSCYEMVLRYAHLASDHLYHAADKIYLPEVKTARDRCTLVTNQLRANVVPLPVRNRNSS